MVGVSPDWLSNHATVCLLSFLNLNITLPAASWAVIRNQVVIRRKFLALCGFSRRTWIGELSIMLERPGLSMRRKLATFPLLTCFILGCGDSSGVGKTFPVSGRITFKDQPWVAETTMVLFKPDRSKGNQTPFEPVGVVDEQGIYAVTTKGKDGAPPGWYKVLVTAAGDYQEHPKAKNRHPGPRSLLPAKYGQEKTSGLAVEVVEHPAANAYDLKLSP